MNRGPNGERGDVDDEPERPVTWTASALLLPSRPDFARASRTTLRLLRQQLGHDLWMVTRVEGDDVAVVDCLDHGYGVRRGDVFPWASTLDWRMVHGLGPKVAPSVAEVPPYAVHAFLQGREIGSYVGVPLMRDGELFGTLTGIHPASLPDAISALLPTVEAFAELLSAVIALELTAAAAARRAERAEAEAHVDQLTQLGNRLAWSKVLVEEEHRCRRFDRPACVLSVDLDGLKRENDAHGHDAGDRLLRTAALVLRRTTRLCDQVARVGGDEFAILAVEASEFEGRALMDRVAGAFARAGVEASIGMAVRDGGDSTLEETWRLADLAMYRHKRRRVTDRVAAALVGDVPHPPLRVVGDGPS
jgi:diguanylate cyclase (GGDEF)-like protein